MLDLLLNILTLGIKPWYEKNSAYSKIIFEFRNKLPRPQNEARVLTAEEKKNLSGLMRQITVLNLAPHKTSVTDQDIDQFYNALNNFDYNFVTFKNYYKGYTANLTRLKPQAANKDMDLAVLQLILKNDPMHPIKPFPVLFFHLKYRIGWSSKIYKFFRRK